MTVQIGAKLDAGFDDPLGMLRDCHRRIESFLSVLCRVAESRQDRPLRPEERTAVESALEYFRTGGRRHTRDEEDSLFPRLKASLSSGDLDTVRELETEHGEADELHATADRLFRAWIDSGSLHQSDGHALLSATQRLRALYAEHIQVEENLVFPKAAAVLDAGAIAVIGSEFRTRRNLPAD